MANDIKKNEKPKGFLFESLLASFLFSLSFFISSPLNLMANNLEEFQISLLFDYLFRMLALFSVGFLILWALTFISMKVSKYGRKIIYALFIAITIWLHYFPVSSGILDGFEQIKSSPIAIIIGLAIGAAFFVFDKFSKIGLLVMSAGPLLMSLLFFVPFALNSSNSESLNSPIALSSTQNNVMVISFDGVEIDDVNTVLKKRPDLTSKLDGFTQWENMTSVSPFTLLSMRSTKLGYLPEGDSILAAREDYITKVMGENNYNLEFFGLFARNEAEEPHKNILPDLAMVQPSRDDYYQKALAASVVRIAPYISVKIQKALNVIFNFLGAPEDSVAKEIAKDIRKNNISNKLDINSYKGFVSQLKTGNEKPTLRFHHYLFSHFPDTFNSECNYVPAGQVSDIALDIPQAECAVTLMVSLVDRLKKIGVYDNTTIFFTSDHGKVCFFNEPGSPGSYKVSSQWCLSRYLPYMLTKPQGASGELIYRNDQTSLLDIAKTICENSEINNKSQVCSKYIGGNLFGAPEQLKASKRAILVGPKKGVGRSYSNYDVVDISREQSIFEHFDLSHDWSQKQLDPLRCTKNVSFGFEEYKGQKYFGRGFGVREDWGRKTEGQKGLIYFKMEKKACKEQKISLNLTSLPDSGKGGAKGRILLNGKLIEKFALNVGEPTSMTIDLSKTKAKLMPGVINVLTIQRSADSVAKNYDVGMIDMVIE